MAKNTSEMARREIGFPTRTPAPAIRCRSSQGFPRANLLGVLMALVFGSALCPAAQSATLSWDANSEPDIAGYKLYYRTADGSASQVIDVGNTTTFSVPNLAEGITYLFTVTAYNDASLESQPSNEVSYTAGPINDTALLTVNNGTGGGNYPVGTFIVVRANAPPEGSQFAGWTGDVPILSNPSVPTTTATIPFSDVTITATYSGSD